VVRCARICDMPHLRFHLRGLVMVDFKIVDLASLNCNRGNNSPNLPDASNFGVDPTFFSTPDFDQCGHSSRGTRPGTINTQQCPAMEVLISPSFVHSLSFLVAPFLPHLRYAFHRRSFDSRRGRECPNNNRSFHLFLRLW
jgi:hypothetical protein